MTARTRAASTAPDPASHRASVRALFHVTAQAHPGMAPRLIEPFAKLGLVPTRIHISSEDGNGDELTADLRVGPASREAAHLIEKALRRIVGVRQVIALTE